MKLLTKNISKILVLSLSVVIASCSSTSKDAAEGDSSASIPDGVSSSIELQGSSDENTAGPLKTVYFDYNSASLSDTAKADLEANASFMKMTDAVAIQIEGHADERGGVQYNIALGEKRAQSVKEYLEALGVDGSRVTTVSYGKDRPNTFGHDEDSWSRNRRANFVITAK